MPRSFSKSKPVERNTRLVYPALSIKAHETQCPTDQSTANGSASMTRHRTKPPVLRFSSCDYSAVR